MNKLTKIIGAAAAATLVAASGSAFTASSTIADAAVNVGSVSQSVSGVTVTKVEHTYDASNDTTSAVKVTVSEVLDTTAGVMKVKVNGGETLKECDAATSPVEAPTTSVVNCTIGVANVTSLQFIVNG